MVIGTLHVEKASSGRGATQEEEPGTKPLRGAFVDNTIELYVWVNEVSKREPRGGTDLRSVGDDQATAEASGQRCGEPVMMLQALRSQTLLAEENKRRTGMHVSDMARGDSTIT